MTWRGGKSSPSCVLLLVAVISWLLPDRGDCDLVLELQEELESAMSVSLSTWGDRPRPIALVPGHTYYIMCRDTSALRRFDDEVGGVEPWQHNSNTVSHLRGPPPQGSGESRVFASTEVSSQVNEWTLVLQVFGGGAVGVYRCVGLEEGQSVALDIRQSPLTVIAGMPELTLTAGTLNDVISLSPFISPSPSSSSSSSSSSITWLFNGLSEPSFPTGAQVLQRSELILRSPITPDMRGNFTCSVQSGGVTATAVFTIKVNVVPHLVPRPPSSSSGGQQQLLAFAGGTLNISCQDTAGFPQSDISWNQNETALTSGGRVTVTNTKTADSALSTLLLDPVLSADVGVYRCTTQNVAGSAQGSVQLARVLDVSGDLERSVWWEGETLTLAVEIPWEGATDLADLLSWQWTKDGQPLPSSSSSSSSSAVQAGGSYVIELRVGGALENDSGVYACRVSSPLSAKVVTFDPVSVVGGDSVSFQLRLLDIGSCQDWLNDAAESKAEIVSSSIVAGVNHLCPSCHLTTSHITLPLFRCFPASPQAVTFRARLFHTSSTTSHALLRQVEAWLHMDGTAGISISAVFTSVDQSCPVAISSPRDPECNSADSALTTQLAVTTTTTTTTATTTTVAANNVSDKATAAALPGVPVVLVIAVSAGVGGLLVVVVVGVVITAIIIVALSHRRRSLAVAEGKREKSPQAILSAVNPSRYSAERGVAMEEGVVATTEESCDPQYEDIDKYDYIRKMSEGPYEKMTSIQIVPTTIKNNDAADNQAPQIMPASNQAPQIMPTTKTVPLYDYAAI